MFSDQTALQDKEKCVGQTNLLQGSGSCNGDGSAGTSPGWNGHPLRAIPVLEHPTITVVNKQGICGIDNGVALLRSKSGDE